MVLSQQVQLATFSRSHHEACASSRSSGLPGLTQDRGCVAFARGSSTGGRQRKGVQRHEICWAHTASGIALVYRVAQFVVVRRKLYFQCVLQRGCQRAASCCSIIIARRSLALAPVPSNTPARNAMLVPACTSAISTTSACWSFPNCAAPEWHYCAVALLRSCVVAPARNTMVNYYH